MFRKLLDEGQAGVSFDPSSTTPALGRKIVKYEWSYGDSQTESRNVPTTVVHTYDKTGEYFVKLIVTDNIGVKDSKIVKLYVKSLAGNIKVSPSTGNVNTEFQFTGVSSRSDDGVIKNYDWSIDDSKGKKITSSQKSTFTYRFAIPGTYNVTLLVTDITGATDKVVKELTPLDLMPKVDIDGYLELSEMGRNLVSDLEKLEPFGNGNPEPVFLIKDVTLIDKPRLLKDKHVKASVFSHGVIKPVIFFNRPELFPIMNQLGDKTFTLAGSVSINEWNGRTNVEVQGVDVVV